MTAGAFPANIKGPFIVRCQVTAKPGKANLVEALMARVRACAESDAEPGCLSWRPTRGINGNTDVFSIYEKYSGPEAFFFHSQQPALQEFVKADLVNMNSIQFFDESGNPIN